MPGRIGAISSPAYDARRREPAERADPRRGHRRAQLEPARQPPVERGERDVHRHLVPLGEPPQQVEVAGDQRRLGDDARWRARDTAAAPRGSGG